MRLPTSSISINPDIQALIIAIENLKTNSSDWIPLAQALKTLNEQNVRTLDWIAIHDKDQMDFLLTMVTQTQALFSEFWNALNIQVQGYGNVLGVIAYHAKNFVLPIFELAKNNDSFLECLFSMMVNRSPFGRGALSIIALHALGALIQLLDSMKGKKRENEVWQLSLNCLLELTSLSSLSPQNGIDLNLISKCFQDIVAEISWHPALAVFLDTRCEFNFPVSNFQFLLSKFPDLRLPLMQFSIGNPSLRYQLCLILRGSSSLSNDLINLILSSAQLDFHLALLELAQGERLLLKIIAKTAMMRNHRNDYFLLAIVQRQPQVIPLLIKLAKKSIAFLKQFSVILKMRITGNHNVLDYIIAYFPKEWPVILEFAKSEDVFFRNFVFALDCSDTFSHKLDRLLSDFYREKYVVARIFNVVIGELNEIEEDVDVYFTEETLLKLFEKYDQGNQNCLDVVTNQSLGQITIFLTMSEKSKSLFKKVFNLLCSVSVNGKSLIREITSKLQADETPPEIFSLEEWLFNGYKIGFITIKDVINFLALSIDKIDVNPYEEIISKFSELKVIKEVPDTITFFKPIQGAMAEELALLQASLSSGSLQGEVSKKAYEFFYKKWDIEEASVKYQPNVYKSLRYTSL